MTKPSPLDQEFWDVFGELFGNRVADILDDDECPFQVVAVVYPGEPLPNYGKGVIVEPRGD
jgi:hypothetical protein